MKVSGSGGKSGTAAGLLVKIVIGSVSKIVETVTAVAGPVRLCVSSELPRCPYCELLFWAAELSQFSPFPRLLRERSLPVLPPLPPFPFPWKHVLAPWLSRPHVLHLCWSLQLSPKRHCPLLKLSQVLPTACARSGLVHAAGGGAEVPRPLPRPLEVPRPLLVCRLVSSPLGLPFGPFRDWLRRSWTHSVSARRDWEAL